MPSPIWKTFLSGFFFFACLIIFMLLLDFRFFSPKALKQVYLGSIFTKNFKEDWVIEKTNGATIHYDFDETGRYLLYTLGSQLENHEDKPNQIVIYDSATSEKKVLGNLDGYFDDLRINKTDDTFFITAVPSQNYYSLLQEPEPPVRYFKIYSLPDQNWEMKEIVSNEEKISFSKSNLIPMNNSHNYYQSWAETYVSSSGDIRVTSFKAGSACIDNTCINKLFLETPHKIFSLPKNTSPYIEKEDPIMADGSLVMLLITFEGRSTKLLKIPSDKW